MCDLRRPGAAVPPLHQTGNDSPNAGAQRQDADDTLPAVAPDTFENLIFRSLCLSDLDEIRRFYADMGEESAAFFNVDHGNERRTMEFFENGKRDHRFYVASDGERIAGLVFIWDIDRALPWLGLAVRDDYQGRGVGTFLLQALFSYLRMRGYGGLILRTAKTNAGARHLYEKTGFECVGEHPSGELLYIKRFKMGEFFD